MATKKVNNQAAAPAEQPVASASATPAAPVKKNHTVLIIVLVLVFFLFVMPALVIGGLGWYAKKKINDATKNGFSYGGIEVNTNSNQKWPTSMPSGVPEFKDGKIENSGRLGDAWTVTFSGVEREEALKYQAALTSSGFTVQEPADLGSLYTVGATKDDINVNIAWNGGDEKSMLVTVTKGINLDSTTEE